jgi:hypothetical protein
LSELNSALNRWVDAIPAHRKCVHCTYHTLLTSSQYGGIQITQTKRSSVSLRCFTPFTTWSRCSFTDNSFHERDSTRYFRFPPLPYVLMQLVRALAFSMYNKSGTSTLFQCRWFVPTCLISSYLTLDDTGSGIYVRCCPITQNLG